MEQKIRKLQEDIRKLVARCDKVSDEAKRKGWEQTSEFIDAASGSLVVAQDEDLGNAIQAARAKD